MSVILDLALKCNVAETLTVEVDAAPKPVVNHTAFSSRQTLTSATTVPVTEVSAETIALAAGAYTIDLEALNGTNGSTVVGTGLKVQLFKIKNTGTNTMTVSEGVANGYALLGASFTFDVEAGMEAEFFLNDAAPDVAGADSEIDIAGTAAETFELMIVLG